MRPSEDPDVFTCDQRLPEVAVILAKEDIRPESREGCR